MNLLNISKRIAAVFCVLTLLPQNHFIFSVFATGDNPVNSASLISSENRVLSKNIMNTYNMNTEDKNSFFSLTSRLRYTDRWVLFQNAEKKEDLADHSLEVGVLAHALALIKNKKFGGNVDAERAALLGMYHDMPEIITGDLPSPVKYYDDGLKFLYAQIEDKSADEMISLLPEEFKEEYSKILKHSDEDEEIWSIVKSADTLSAVIKCLREKKVGNNDFDKVYADYSEKILSIAENAPEVDYFIKIFMPSFGFTYPEKQAIKTSKSEENLENMPNYNPQKETELKNIKGDAEGCLTKSDDEYSQPTENILK